MRSQQVHIQPDLFNKIRYSSTDTAQAVSVLLYGCTTSNEMHGEKARWGLQKNIMFCFEQILEATSHQTAYLKSSN